MSQLSLFRYFKPVRRLDASNPVVVSVRCVAPETLSSILAVLPCDDLKEARLVCTDWCAVGYRLPNIWWVVRQAASECLRDVQARSSRLSDKGCAVAIELDDDFSQPLDGLDLRYVRKLKFGYSFNQPLAGLDLRSVQELQLGDSFNQPLVGLDLGNIRKLSFGCYFNQPVQGLDFSNLRVLIFGHCGHEYMWSGCFCPSEGIFNQPLNGLDLSNVRVLALGTCFNQPLDGLVLSKVEVLKIGSQFKQQLAGLDLRNLPRLESNEPYWI